MSNFDDIFLEVLATDSLLHDRNLVLALRRCLPALGGGACVGAGCGVASSKSKWSIIIFTYRPIIDLVFPLSYLICGDVILQPIDLSQPISLQLPAWLRVNPSIHQTFGWSVSQSVHRSNFSFVHLSVYPSMYLSSYPALIHLSIHLSADQSIHISSYFHLNLSTPAFSRPSIQADHLIQYCLVQSTLIEPIYPFKYPFTNLSKIYYLDLGWSVL